MHASSRFRLVGAYLNRTSFPRHKNTKNQSCDRPCKRKIRMNATQLWGTAIITHCLLVTSWRFRIPNGRAFNGQGGTNKIFLIILHQERTYTYLYSWDFSPKNISRIFPDFFICNSVYWSLVTPNWVKLQRVREDWSISSQVRLWFLQVAFFMRYIFEGWLVLCSFQWKYRRLLRWPI